MADTFKGIITADGKKRQLPYESVLETPVSDETLSIQGGFADAKVVGNNFKKAKAETDSLKEDLVDIEKGIVPEELCIQNGSAGRQIDYSTGLPKYLGSTDYCVTDYISTDGIPSINYSIYANFYASSNVCTIAAYNSNKEFLPNLSVKRTFPGIDKGVFEITDEIKFIAISFNATNSTAKSTLSKKGLENAYQEIDNNSKAIKDIDLSLQIAETNLCIPTSHTGRHIGQDGNEIYPGDSNYMYSDFFDVSGYKYLHYSIWTGRKTDDVTYKAALVACYDINQTYLKSKSLIVDMIPKINSGIFEIQEGVKFVRVSFVNKKHNPYCIASNSKYRTNAFYPIPYRMPSQVSSNLALQRPTSKICAWIDDDGDANGGMQRVISVCDDLGIRCSFAVNTSKFNNSPTSGDYSSFLEYYKYAQELGFDIVSHSHTHEDYWYPESKNYDIAKIRKDLALTFRALSTNGFNHKVFVYPGSGASKISGDSNIATKREVSQYFDFAFVAWAYDASLNDYDYIPCDERYYKFRFFLDPSKDELFKSYVSKCKDVGRMPVIATHSSTEMSAWDDSYTRQCVQYLIDEGYEFRTISQAVEIVRPMQDLIDLFGGEL